MKRILLLLTALALLLTGCDALPGGEAAGGKKLLQALSPYYTTSFQYESGGLAVTAAIDNTAPDSCSITVTAPEHLAGYTYRIGENGIEIAYRELSYTLDPTGAATAAPPLQAASALSVLLRPGPDELPVREGDFWTLSGQLESGGAVLSFAEKSGLPTKLSLQGGRIQITFENFVFFG